MSAIDPKVVQFLYDHVRDAPERQITDSRDLDAKTVQVFGAASIVIGLAGLSGGGLHGGDAITVVLMAALICYVLCTAFAICSLWPREFWRSLHADTLWREYWQDPADSTRHALLDNIAKAYEHNRKLLSSKAKLVRWALMATGAETTLVGLAVVLARLV